MHDHKIPDSLRLLINMWDKYISMVYINQYVMINNLFHAFKSPFMLEIFIIKSIRHQQRTIIQLLQCIASVPYQKINIRPFKIFKVYIWVEVHVNTCVLTNNIKSKFWIFFLPSIFKVNKQKRPQELYHLFSGFYEPGWFMFWV